MMFIGEISRGQKILDYVRTVIYDRCGRYGRYQVYMTYMYFNLFFISLFRWNKRFFVKISRCEAIYELEPGVGKALLYSQQVDMKSTGLTLVQEGRRRGYCDSGTYKTWEECGNCRYETEKDFEYCPKCGRRLWRMAACRRQGEKKRYPQLI